MAEAGKFIAICGSFIAAAKQLCYILKAGIWDAT
jgi:hypothetical protein